MICRTSVWPVGAAAVAMALFVGFGMGTSRADNSLYGSYDFEGKANFSLGSSSLPFGLGILNLGNNVAASGKIKLQSNRLIVQLEEPIRRREVIKLDRKLRATNRNSFRYRKSGMTDFRGNRIEYRIALRLKRKDGKWGGRGKVVTVAKSGDLAGSRANVRGRLQQQ